MAKPPPASSRPLKKPAGPATLYVVATPIGNLEDLTLRAARILKATPHLFAESTDAARILLAHLGVKRVVECYTESRREPASRQILGHLNGGDDVALISEAGTPGVSDPGADLVHRVAAAGHRVVPVPGPSALTTLLSVAGHGAERFQFEGYLPRKSGDRRRVLDGLKEADRALVFFEAPHRVRESLDDLCALLGQDRRAVAGRELTKVHEEVRRGTLAELREWTRSAEPRGEYVFLVLAASATPTRLLPPADAEIARRIEMLMRDEGLPRSRAAARVASETGLPRKQVYRIGLPLAPGGKRPSEEGEEE